MMMIWSTPARKNENLSVLEVYANFISLFHECDAAIVASSYAYESASLDALKPTYLISQGIKERNNLLTTGTYKS